MMIRLKSYSKLDKERVGAKAFNLNLLFKLGYSICDGSIVPGHYFAAFCSYNKFDVRSKNIKEHIQAGEFSPHFKRALLSVYQTLSKRSGLLVVRSTFLEEDGAAQSYAGIFESVTNVSTFNELLLAIKTVWISYFTSTVRQDSAHNRLFAMPVLIQEMVKCRKSGVTFTRNPITNQKPAVTEACRGHNEQILHNRVQSDTSILTKHELRTLSSLSEKLETDLGFPCDYEWGFCGKTLYIFQVRPIQFSIAKNLYSAPKEDGLDCILLDRYAAPASVCYLSLLDSWQNKVYLSYYTRRRGYTFDEKPLCFLYNRVYWNVRYQKKYFEDIGRGSRWKRWRLIHLILTGYRSWYRRIPKYDKKICNYKKTMETADDPRALLDLLEKVIQTFCGYIGVDHYRFLGLAQVLYKSVERRCDASPLQKQDVLAAIGQGRGKNKTVEANNDILNMIDAILADEALKKLFETETEEAIYLAITTKSPFLFLGNMFQEFIKLHGHRGISCDDLYFPHWNENPLTVLTLMKQLLQNHAIRQKDSLRAVPKIKDKKLRLLVKLASEYMQLRENQRYYFDKSWVLLRQILLKLSVFYKNSGLLQEEQDIFHMTIDEIKLGIQYHGYTVDRKTIQERKKAYVQEMGNTPPYIIKNSQKISVQKDKRSSSYKGMGISAGIASGKIKIIRSIHDLNGITGSTIGLVNTFHPSWTPILKMISGLIMNYGNMLSHGAVIAREYGIPVVVFNGDATKLFQNGDFVKINGATGRISLPETCRQD